MIYVFHRTGSIHHFTCWPQLAVGGTSVLKTSHSHTPAILATLPSSMMLGNKPYLLVIYVTPFHLPNIMKSCLSFSTKNLQHKDSKYGYRVIPRSKHENESEIKYKYYLIHHAKLMLIAYSLTYCRKYNGNNKMHFRHTFVSIPRHAFYGFSAFIDPE